MDSVALPARKGLALVTLGLAFLFAAFFWAGCSRGGQTTTTSTPVGQAQATITTVTAAPSSVTPPTGNQPGGTPATVRCQEDNAYLAYTGFWTQSVTPDGADGDFLFATGQASVTVRFNGTYVAYIAKKAYIYGIAGLTLDDRAPVPVDLYSDLPQWQQTVWDSGPLPPGSHTLKVQWTGRQRVGGRGTYVNIDAFEISGNLLFASPPTRVEQNDPRFFYTGTWNTSADPSASAGSFRFANSPGATVTFAFNGPHFAWIAKTGPQYGKAKVTMYGRLNGTAPDPLVVDLYSPTEAWKQVVLEAPFDSAGPTSVTVEWTGTKSAAATDTNIGIDAVDIVGRLVQVPARYEETRGREYAFSDTFSWNVYSPASSASGAKYCYTNLVGATATIRFNGRYLAWIAKKAPVYGIARVTLDDGPPVEVNLYSANTLWRQHVWNTGLLSPGNHTVRIECTGRKAAGATKAFINIDGFDIVGELLGY